MGTQNDEQFLKDLELLKSRHVYAHFISLTVSTDHKLNKWNTDFVLYTTTADAIDLNKIKQLITEAPYRLRGVGSGIFTNGENKEFPTALCFLQDNKLVVKVHDEHSGIVNVDFALQGITVENGSEITDSVEMIY